MRIRPLLVPCLLPAGTAMADMPRYDVKAHCAEIASFGGSYSESLNQSCFEMEQVAYDGLKPGWDALPSAMRTHCDEIARFGESGSYSLLEACIQQEAKAASSPKSFKY